MFIYVLFYFYLMKILSIKSEFDLPLSCLFQWHLRKGAFERLNPPWHPLYIISKKGSIDNEGIVIVKMPIIKDFGIKWKIKHKDYIDNKSFKDVQIKGLFHHWEHLHNFSESMTKSILEDNIKYNLPLGRFGNIISPIVDNNLTNIFKYRHRIIKIDNDAHLKFKNPKINSILISGSSGFIGSALTPFFTTGGYDVTRLLRNKLPSEYDIAERIYLNRDKSLSSIDCNFDAVINLNGESIFGLWSKDKKLKILDSRVKFTQSLSKNLA
jgi:uncharacterized protein